MSKQDLFGLAVPPNEFAPRLGRIAPTHVNELMSAGAVAEPA